VIEQAKKRPLTETIRTVGTVGYDEDLLAHVHPRARGWVERLEVASIGATVKQGDVLFEYYSPDIVSAQQDYLVALRRGMNDLIESSRARLELLDVPESVIDAVREQRKVQRTIPLLAPQDGYVAEINLREGMYIEPGLDLYTIARRLRVWVNVDVLERRMQSVNEGQQATMRVDGLPGRTFEGTVDFVYPELDPQSRTLRVRLAFANEDGQLRPNQFAEVTLTPEEAPRCSLCRRRPSFPPRAARAWWYAPARGASARWPSRPVPRRVATPRSSRGWRPASRWSPRGSS